MQDQILDMLLKKDEITWQDMLYDLVKTEQMDPWDIDVSLLTQKYLETIKRLQEINFFVSGKVILASAILLKIKSTKLLTENIARFDQFLFQPEEEQLEELQDFEQTSEIIQPKLTIKTPQARKRKVTIQDLVGALEKALEVEKRRRVRKLEQIRVPENIKVPEKTIDIGQKIKEVYKKVKDFFSFKKEKLTFTKLVMSKKREDKIYTFIPLLHLSNQSKIELNQEQHFGEIEISLKK
jgi:segregation and condensation protein A